MPAILVTLVVFVLLSMGRGLPERVSVTSLENIRNQKISCFLPSSKEGTAEPLIEELEVLENGSPLQEPVPHLMR